ncbi:hypothetical protein FX016_23290 [Cupriavidus gilardii]|nr:hypothetical protein FX016_23290 [Cupriavidus gilardii]
MLEHDDAAENLAALAAPYARPHITSGHQSVAILLLLTDPEGFKATVRARKEQFSHAADRVEPIVAAVQAMAENGSIHHIPLLLRATGEVDPEAQTGAMKNLKGIIGTRYFVNHLQLPGEVVMEWAFEHPDWMDRIVEHALDEVNFQLVAQAIEEAVRERMARS